MRARHKTYWPTDKNYINNNKTNKNYLTGDVESMDLPRKPGQTKNYVLKGTYCVGGMRQFSRRTEQA
jgi:hypothetical protein